MENFCFMQYGKMNFYCGNAHASTSFFEYVKAGARVLKVSDHLLHVQLPPRVTCSFPAEPPLQVAPRLQEDNFVALLTTTSLSTNGTRQWSNFLQRH